MKILLYNFCIIRLNIALRNQRAVWNKSRREFDPRNKIFGETKYEMVPTIVKMMEGLIQYCKENQKDMIVEIFRDSNRCGDDEQLIY